MATAPAKRFMGEVRAKFPKATFGVYDCRPIRHRANLSQHSYANAVDTFAAKREMYAIAQWAAANKTRLGIATLCYDPAGFRGCTTAHTSHVHVDFNPQRSGPCKNYDEPLGKSSRRRDPTGGPPPLDVAGDLLVASTVGALPGVGPILNLIGFLKGGVVAATAGEAVTIIKRVAYGIGGSVLVTLGLVALMGGAAVKVIDQLPVGKTVTGAVKAITN